ncbi:hypothetical protein PROFUN_13129 [Planoprotostelium fungivorum]|uniref:Nucleoplasmin-like domain-containing protein n=1 Tax=Planoprotostelium fungivorum TaxID=1890364 RepID=A0A2P6N524_9EUKA|nr:hypothetical protein PROFUN_13129 [Planoprotostelium fungivorum]
MIAAVIEPGITHVHRIPEGYTLALHNITLDAEEKAGVNRLYFSKGGQKFLLATLTDKTPQIRSNYLFSDTEDSTQLNVEGKYPIHLTGVMVEDSDDEDIDSEEAGSDEESLDWQDIMNGDDSDINSDEIDERLNALAGSEEEEPTPPPKKQKQTAKKGK